MTTDAASVGIAIKKEFTFTDSPDGFRLESGEFLGPVTLAYETYGTLNRAKDNAILITHALTGDAHAAGYYHETDAKPGWWDNMVGPGKGIDTNQYFVICSNVIGGCSGSTGPSSANPKTGAPYGSEFKTITIGDMVHAQKRLIDHLGIDRLFAVIGGSVGGMQVLEWCCTYPERVGSAIALATTMRHSALNIAFNEVARQSIRSDPNWKNGDYYACMPPNIGLSLARMVGHITYLSDEAMHRKFGRRFQDGDVHPADPKAVFSVESYLHHQGARFIERFDANSLMTITRAADYFDALKKLSDPETSQRISAQAAKYLVISFTSDWLYPTYQSRETVAALKKIGCNVSFCEIASTGGHDSFLLPSGKLSGVMGGFLSGVQSDRSNRRLKTRLPVYPGIA